MKITLDNTDHTFVIAEAGSNWKVGSFEEDLKQAKNLITIAADAGADAVKFQTYRPETVYASNAGKSEYLSKNGITEDIHSIFERHAMPYEMIPKLAEFCKEKNILFMSSPFSIHDAKELDPFVEIHKVASFEMNHIRLLEFLFKTQKPIIISTGASTYDEIDFLLNLAKKYKNESIALLQCTSKYPSPSSALNLSVIPKLKLKYRIPVGFSDHSINPVIGPILAVGFGATIIEKHFTLDKSLPGPDHSFALNPDELKVMIHHIREADKAKGNGEKKILEEEKELRHFATRSIQAIKHINKGDVLLEGQNFEVLRPGNRIRGTEARFLDIVEGKRSLKIIEPGDGVLDYE